MRLVEWGFPQDGPRSIPCLRPSEKKDLPLTLLRQLFNEFHRRRLQPLPNSPEGVNALQVALNLCNRKGDGFNTEYNSIDAFGEAMGNFSRLWSVRCA